MDDTILNTRFWLSIKYLLKESKPIIKVLTLVDGETKPNMAYLYEAFLEAKTTIIKNFAGVASSYCLILNILDKQWAKHYKSPLVEAAFFLNLAFYNKLEE